MPSITSSDVTVTLTGRARVGNELKITGTIAYGNGALTYPTGGVPLPVVSVFRTAVINRMHLLGGEAIGYIYKYDQTNHKIRMYQTAALTPAGTISAPTFTGTPATPSTILKTWSIQNILGADADVAGSMTTDQASGCTNDDRIDTFAAIAGGAWTYSENNEIDVPRNVGISIYNDSGGPLNMEEAAFSAAITGTFRGSAQSDTISETFTAGNKAIANTKYRWKYGVKPFETITSVVVTGLTANQNNLKIGIGLGRLLGVPQDFKDGVIADVLKVVKNSANLALGSAVYDATNKTLDLGALADNDDLDIIYEVGGIVALTPAGTCSAPTFTGGATTAAALGECGTGVAPAAVTLTFEAWGR